MGRFKIYAGISLFMQAITFLAILLFSASGKRKRALLFGTLAAGFGTLGSYLVLKGNKESTPVLDFDSAEDSFEDENRSFDIECSILSDAYPESDVLRLR